MPSAAGFMRGRARTLQNPEGDQAAEAGGEAAQPGAEDEHRQASLENCPASDPVGKLRRRT